MAKQKIDSNDYTITQFRIKCGGRQNVMGPHTRLMLCKKRIEKLDCKFTKFKLAVCLFVFQFISIICSISLTLFFVFFSPKCLFFDTTNIFPHENYFKVNRNMCCEHKCLLRLLRDEPPSVFFPQSIQIKQHTKITWSVG